MGLYRTIVSITGPSLPSPAGNVWHARTDTAPLGDEDSALAHAATALATFYSAIAGLYPSGHEIAWDGRWEQFHDPSPRVVGGQTPWSQAATGGDGLPAANCLLIDWQSSLASRRGRGRTFIGPVVLSAAENNGTPEESNRSALQAAVDDLVSASTDLGEEFPWALGVWSRSDSVLRDFVSGFVPNRFGVLRSRRD